MDIILFFLNDTATTEIYTLSLHDALPISLDGGARRFHVHPDLPAREVLGVQIAASARSELRSEGTRLNSSHSQISYAVFCLKKKRIRPTNCNIYQNQCYMLCNLLPRSSSS